MTHNLFISHKHSDARIAQVVADFVESRSLGQVSVHMSSDPRYKGPRLGRNINQELCAALYNCDVLLLLYTSADEDWSYCMFECGVATDPQSPRTNIIVFQCGEDAPKPFADQLRVNVRDLKALRKFTKAFFTEPGFFPNEEAAFAPNFSEDRCDEAARLLYDSLGVPGVLPPLEKSPIEDIRAWPLLRLEVALNDIDAITQGDGSAAPEACRRLLLDRALISYSSNRAPILFGLDSFPPNMVFGSLLEQPTPTPTPQSIPAWVESCAAQILRAAHRQLTNIRWESFAEANGDRIYTPIVTRMRRIPAAGRAQFDIHFFELENPHSVTVAERMIEVSNIYLKRFNATTKDMRLRDLRDEMSGFDKERLPIVGEDWRPLYIVHRSMLERHMLDQQLRGEALDELTVGRFLEEIGAALAETFVTLVPTASLADAQRAMGGTVRDVFVTVDGNRDSPVLGWLSNVRLTRNL